MDKSYVIQRIDPKDGQLQEVHRSILGRVCMLILLERGKHSLIEVNMNDADEWHMICTSEVRDFHIDQSNGNIVFETHNTIYTLAPCKEE